MSDKSSDFDIDRQAFVQPPAPRGGSAPRFGGPIFAVAAIAAIAFLGYKLVPQIMRETGSASDPAVADLDKRLATIEGRLEKLDATRRAAVPGKAAQPPDPKETPSKPAAKTIYQISPAPVRPVQAPRASAPAPDAATAQRLSNLQQGLGALESGQTANHEAWQATTDRLADVEGQVGVQGVEILKNQDELNQLLASTTMEAIPFELQRGANPQPVGPVSILLKSSNPKTQRYTLCVYIQTSCIELKDRPLHEVVQFVVTRNSTPLAVIATKIMKDEILGYLEVPRNQSEH
jgi:hypothetical protein